MIEYLAEITRHMNWFYQSLSEKDGRRYTAVEAEKLGYSGIAFVARLLGCDPTWAGKNHVTFSNASAAVRRWLWQNWTFENPHWKAVFQKIPKRQESLLLNTLSAASQMARVELREISQSYERMWDHREALQIVHRLGDDPPGIRDDRQKIWGLTEIAQALVPAGAVDDGNDHAKWTHLSAEKGPTCG